MKKMILVDVMNRKVDVIEVKGELDDYYTRLNCTCIDITQREINGKLYDIVCDDEGLFKASPRISAMNYFYEPSIVGNLLICNSNEEGELTSLSDSDIDRIRQSIVYIKNGNAQRHPVVFINNN